MLCPHCKEVRLAIADRQGIEVDYCPQCRGVWLDRGELDKLIHHRGHEAGRPMPAPGHETRHDSRHDPKHDPKYDPRYDPKYDARHDPRRSKRKGFLSEIFDFD